MGVVVPHKAIDAISNVSDPKKAILDFIGDLSGMTIFQNRVLVAVYMRPEKTKGGIIRPDMNKEEDVWQSKVGLVLKWGNQAFQDDGEYRFSDADKAMIGDWVTFNVNDSRMAMIRNYPCRFVRDASIICKTTDPDMTF